MTSEAIKRIVRSYILKEQFTKMYCFICKVCCETLTARLFSSNIKDNDSAPPSGW